MPYRKYHKKSAFKKKRTFKKRSFPRKTSVSKIPFPPQFYTRLRYAETKVALQSTTGSIATAAYRLNSCYDPNVALGGGQPRYFDTLCSADDGVGPYFQYLVTGCAWRVQVMGVATNVPGTVIVGYRDENAGVPSGTDEAMMRRGYKSRQVGRDTGGNSITVFKGYISMSRLFGVSRRGLLDGQFDYGAVYNANPVRGAVLDIMWEPNTTSSSDVSVNVQLTYYVKFSGINDVSDS